MSKKHSALGGIVGFATAAVGGMYSLATGMLDPTWLVAHRGAWFGIATVATQMVLPKLAGGIPWTGFTLVFAVLFIAATLVSLYKKEKKKT